MPYLQIELSGEDSAKLSFIAEYLRQGRPEVAVNLLSKSIAPYFNRLLSGEVPPPSDRTQLRTRPGKRGTAVLYRGQDGRLRAGTTYRSYAEVLRLIRRDLVPNLYDRRTHRGNNAKTLLRQHEPQIFSALEPVQAP